MSTHARHRQGQSPGTRSPYATDRNWWYDSRRSTGDAPEASADTRIASTGYSDLQGVSRADFVAHMILKQTAELLDLISLNEPPGPDDLHRQDEQVPVSDPEEVVPNRQPPRDHGDRGQDYGTFPHR